MKILHTSDWHIGRSLYGHKRYDEFAQFLDWLADFINAQRIDALLIAGDVFDTSTPSNLAQQLYYGFLCKVAAGCCRHIVIIAGNHDSPTFLNAPKELLKALNVHVIGSITPNPEDEVIVLKDKSGITEAIICAVPYLRDRDIRKANPGESLDDKNTNLIHGMAQHYEQVGKIAADKFEGLGNIPVIGMGHLFAAGGKTIDGDGVRELYVGSLAHIDNEMFPKNFDYVALGHLHVPQLVGKKDHIRYSGSPIPMGFGEAKQTKKIMMAQFENKSLTLTEHPIPSFQALERISGSMDEIAQRIFELKTIHSKAWLEIEYTGKKIAGNLRQMIEDVVADTDMEVLRIRNKSLVDRIINRKAREETLDNLDVNDVFTRLLDAHEISDEERGPLILAYQETIKTLNEEDSNAQ
jgi:exonuclease SbcD